MERGYKVIDAENDNLMVTVESHYFTKTEAKEVYRGSMLDSTKKDDSILITISNTDYAEIHGKVSFGVIEAEQFALKILNLCNAIKN